MGLRGISVRSAGRGTRIIAILLLLAGIWPTPGLQAQSKEITVGFHPMLGAEKTAAKYQPLIKHLAKTMGVKINPFFPETYSELLKAMMSAKVDFALMAPLNYVEARNLAAVEAFAIELSPEGLPGYHALLISSAKSGIKKIDDGAGKVLAFCDPESTSGFLAPNIYFLRERKQTIASFTPSTVMAGSHLAVVQGVAEGRYALGATNDLDFAGALKILKLSPTEFNILWKSELIPGSPFVARQGMAPELKSSMLKALVSINRDRATLKQMGIGGYVPGRDSDYNLVREMQKYLAR